MRFYGTVRTLFRPVGRWYFNLRVEGSEHLPEGPAILAANHVSWLDPIALGAACPRPIRFLIARSVFERRCSRWFYAGMGTIPVERGSRDTAWFRKALRALREGELVGVFPEGVGLASAQSSREPRSGALLLAALSGAPFVPVGLAGTIQAWPPKVRFPRPGSVTVRFGEPFTLWKNGERPRRDELRLSVVHLMERIRGLEAGRSA